jgi:putative spermidine/putrescine transport system permease protein
MRDGTKIVLTLILPAAIIFLFFILPLGVSVQRSFQTIEGEFIGFAAYQEMFADPNFVKALLYTLKVALLSTAVAVLFALAVAMVLRRNFIGRRISVFIFQFNASMPHISVASMMLLLFVPVGLISSISFHLGMIDSTVQFPAIVRGSSPLGTIISLAWKFAPFIGLSVLSVLMLSVPDYEQQAATLGAGPIRRFLFILFPMIRPALFSSAIICFAYAFGSYEVPWILGTSDTLAKLSYDIFNNPTLLDKRAVSYAISNFITLVTMSLAAVYFWMLMPRGYNK